MNPEHGAGRDPINVINDPLFTYTRARIPVYPPEKNWQPRVQRWRQCRQQLLHQLCLRQHTCRVRTSVGKTQLRTKLAQFVSVLSLELRLQPFPSLDSSFCLENLDELLNVTR